MIVISQPTYLPWAGYFGLIDASSKFIFLDDVQFDRRSWQQRNRIIISKKEGYLTIPVIKKGKNNQLLKDTLIKDNNFYKNHLKNIYFNYSKTKFFNKYFEHLESLAEPIQSLNNLSEINILLIKKISNLLGMNSTFIKSSDLNLSGSKSEKLINTCNLFNAKEYLSNEGATEYLKKDIDKFKINNINVYIQNFNPTSYAQQSNQFVPYMSILDMLFNEGNQSLDIIRSCIEIQKI